MSDIQPIIQPEQARRILDSLAACGRAYTKVIREQVVPALKRLDAAMWAAYRRAGAPCGDTPEGREQWFNKIAAANRERALAEREAALRLPIVPPRARGQVDRTEETG